LLLGLSGLFGLLGLFWSNVRVPIETVRFAYKLSALQETVKIPIETVRVPIETVRVPIETVKIPIEIVRVPIETVRVPIETVRIPVDNVRASIPKDPGGLLSACLGGNHCCCDCGY
jgi:hypothetical protein